MNTEIKKDIKKLMDKLPEVIAAKKRMSAHIKEYGSLESFNDDHIIQTVIYLQQIMATNISLPFRT